MRKLLVVIFLVFWTIPANGLVFRTGKEVIILENETIDDDLIAFAQTVKISGRVNGDVFAAAQEVEIENEIAGSVYASGSNIKIASKSLKSLWAFCGRLDISGKVEKNLLFFGGLLNADKESYIGKDIIAFGGDIDIKGNVDGILKGNMAKININGKINSVDITVNQTKIGPDAEISGDLKIKSKTELVIDPNAKVLGKTDFQKLETKATKAPKFGNVFKMIFIISRLIIGIILIAIFSRLFRRMNENITNSFWKHLGLGFLLMVIIPVITVIALITIIGIPISIFGVFLFLTFAYLSGIIFATFLGEWLIRVFKKEGSISLYLSFIIGFVIIGIFSIIPYLGFFVRLFVLFCGSGMLLILIQHLWKQTRVSTSV